MRPCWKLSLAALALTLIFSGIANAFTPPSSFSCPRFGTTQRRSSLLQNSLSSEIFVLSFDGAIAKTTDWRISQGIDVALMTWPHLKDFDILNSSAQQEEDDTQWLRNKMRALSPVLTSRPGVSLACDYALLARLLLEEQTLDEGQSNGKRGKYASKFHPRTSSTTNNASDSNSDGNSNSQGGSSRPLTVGEISANWNKGGCLAETVLTKYHVNYKNPLPILQDNVERIAQDKMYDVPEIHDAVLETLADCSGNVIVTVGHESDLKMVEKAFSKMEHQPLMRIVSMNESDTEEKEQQRKDALSFMTDSDEECTGVTLIPVESTHLKTLQAILKQAPSDSTIYVFESSWHALEQAVALFGDNIPRGGSGMAMATSGENLNLSLNFPKWAHHGSSRETQHNEALMNAWTNLVSEGAFSELLSARIVRS